jgi:hypothetical protein
MSRDTQHKFSLRGIDAQTLAEHVPLDILEKACYLAGKAEGDEEHRLATLRRITDAVDDLSEIHVPF